MSDSTEQSKQPVTEAVEEAGPPPEPRLDLDDAERDEREADDAERGDAG